MAFEASLTFETLHVTLDRDFEFVGSAFVDQAHSGMAEAALLGGDPAAFESLVQELMSPQNNARQAAESSFQKMKESVPELCVVSLVKVLRQSPQPDSRTFCAVLLRRVRIRRTIA